MFLFQIFSYLEPPYNLLFFLLSILQDRRVL
nr:MAG TPA: hypothetical protein [Bacteriophage sp.]